MSSQSKDTILALGAVAMAEIAGALLIVAAAVMYSQQAAFVERSWPAPGEVIGLEPERGNVARAAPVIRFETSRGKAVRFRANMPIPWPKLDIGDRVPVLYDPENPESAVVDRFWSVWPSVALPAAGGLLLMIGPAAALVWEIRRTRRARAKRADIIGPAS